VPVPEIGIPVSLGVIGGVLAVTTATSLYASRKQEAREKDAQEVAAAPDRENN
jgi:tellurite resistance protein TerC